MGSAASLSSEPSRPRERTLDDLLYLIDNYLRRWHYAVPQSRRYMTPEEAFGPFVHWVGRQSPRDLRDLQKEALPEYWDYMFREFVKLNRPVFPLIDSWMRAYRNLPSPSELYDWIQQNDPPLYRTLRESAGLPLVHLENILMDYE